jgi:hypothetical protein
LTSNTENGAAGQEQSALLAIDDLIPSATQIRKEAALKEAEKAEEFARLTAAVGRTR